MAALYCRQKVYDTVSQLAPPAQPFHLIQHIWVFFRVCDCNHAKFYFTQIVTLTVTRSVGNATSNNYL